MEEALHRGLLFGLLVVSLALFILLALWAWDCIEMRVYGRFVLVESGSYGTFLPSVVQDVDRRYLEVRAAQ